MRSIFGWSYPPGMNSVPADDDVTCEVCWLPYDGSSKDICECPTCDICGEFGYIDCYVSNGKVNHGLIIDERVLQARERVKERQKEEVEREEAFYRKMELEREENEYQEVV